MRPYLEKIDGVPLERIPAERARRLLEDQAAPDGFHFPARGIGQLMDAMAAAARGGRRRGAPGHRRCAAIAAARRALEAVRRSRRPGGASELAAGQAVVAMPAGAAARLLEPARRPPRSPGPCAMRAVCIVYLAIDPRRGSRAEPWIQVDDPRRAVRARVRAGQLEPGAGAARRAPSIGLECYCQADADDPVWGLDDADARRAPAPRALARPARPARRPRGRAAGRGGAAARAPTRVPDLAQVAGGPGARPLARRRSSGVHLAPGSAVIEAIEAGERAAARGPGGRARPRVDPARCRRSASGRPVATIQAPTICGSASPRCSIRGRVIDHPLERRLYARDGSIAQGDCGLVVLPETTAEVVACVRLAARARPPGGAARLGHRACAAARCRWTAPSCSRWPG